MYTVSAKEILEWKKKQLNYGGEEEALFLLLDTVAGLSKKDFNRHKINSEQTICLKKSVDDITRLWIEHIDTSRPIQQICGSAFWRDLKIRVTTDVLIPRPETELIVDIVNDLFRFSGKELDFVDLGTGSGIIAISLAQYNPTWRGFATEVSEKALEIAKYNCMKLHKSSNLKFSLGDWWRAFEGFSGKFDLVVSNPPYIPSKVYENLSSEIKNYEPMLALNGGSDGLKHIKNIISGAPRFLKNKGWLILENHFDQGEFVKNIFIRNGFHSVKVINDLAGIGRFTIGRYK